MMTLEKIHTFKISRKALLKDLQKLGHFADKRPVQPIMSCVKIVARSTDLVMTVSDLDHWITVYSIGAGNFDGEFCVNLKELTTAIKTLSGDLLTLTHNESLTVSDGSLTQVLAACRQQIWSLSMSNVLLSQPAMTNTRF